MNNYVLFASECWNPEPHSRPTFRVILNRLEEIACSAFVHTTHDSFQTMQDDWRVEIQGMFDELKLRENVKWTIIDTIFFFYSIYHNLLCDIFVWLYSVYWQYIYRTSAMATVQEKSL